MNQFVLDSSVTASWFFEDEKNAYSETVLDRIASGQKAIVPPLWYYEVLNVLVGAQRYKRITQAHAVNIWQSIQDLPIIVDESGDKNRFLEIMTLARQYHLTSYDAAYLELSIRRGLPLVTLDTALKKAARTSGIPEVKNNY